MQALWWISCLPVTPPGPQATTANRKPSGSLYRHYTAAPGAAGTVLRGRPDGAGNRYRSGYADTRAGF